MKENKRLFYGSVVVSLITLTLSIIFHFCINNYITEYISGLFLNIFAGSIMLTFTSLVYYFVERRKLFHSMMQGCLNLRNIFNKLDYLEDIKVCTFEEYKRYYKKRKTSFTEKELKKMYEDYKNFHEENIYSKMEDIMKSYLEINNIDLTEFFVLYDSLDLLIDFKNKKKKNIYNMLFGYTKELRDKICINSYHFEIYFSSKKGNKVVNYKFVRELQKEFFCFEEVQDNDEFTQDFSNVCGTCSYDNIRNVKSFYFNDVIERYNNIFESLGKIAYFDNKYIAEEEN